MPLADDSCATHATAMVGVGLRHEHFNDALVSADEVDFVEIHAENFYMDGGLALSFLDTLRARRPISIHGTSLGLGSRTAIPGDAIAAFRRLIDRVNPILVSDHAAFCWFGADSCPQHTGDLLPIQFDATDLKHLTRNIDRVQQAIGRRLLIENLSSYLTVNAGPLREFDFLQEACRRTGAALLLDLNNLFVNAFNAGHVDPLTVIQDTLNQLEPSLVGEIHLAGCTQPPEGALMIDDHSQPVPDMEWHAYEHALERFGVVPTLVEWDTQLPSWPSLVDEAMIAHCYQQEARTDEC